MTALCSWTDNSANTDKTTAVYIYLGLRTESFLLQGADLFLFGSLWTWPGSTQTVQRYREDIVQLGSPHLFNQRASEVTRGFVTNPVSSLARLDLTHPQTQTGAKTSTPVSYRTVKPYSLFTGDWKVKAICSLQQLHCFIVRGRDRRGESESQIVAAFGNNNFCAPTKESCGFNKRTINMLFNDFYCVHSKVKIHDHD